MRATIATSTVVWLMACTSTAIGQVYKTPTRTSPQGLVTTEGNSKHTDLFSKNSVRFQQIDNTYSAAGVINRLNVRFDGNRAFNHSAPARSWSNVQIHMGYGDLATASTTFATNYKSTPTACFSASVTLPAMSGRSMASPVPWGKGLNIPFSTNFIFFRSLGDLLTEIRTLGNSALGTTAIDAIAWRQDCLATVGPGCMPSTGGPMALRSCIDDIGSTWLWHVDVFNAPTNQPSFGILGAGSAPPPGPLPNPCPQPPGVWVYPSQPWILIPLGVTDAGGSISRSFPIAPVPAVSGSTVFLQAMTPHLPFKYQFALSSSGRLPVAASRADIHSKIVVGSSSTAASGVVSHLGVIFGFGG